MIFIQFTLRNKMFRGKVLTIRTAEKRDRDQIVKVMEDRWRYRHKVYQRRMKKFTKGELDNFEKSFSDPEKYLFLVLTVGDEIVGYNEMGEDCVSDRNVIRIFTLSVMEKCHRQGFGEALLSCGVNVARRRMGGKTVVLNVHIPNTPAIALYNKHGFTQQGKTWRTDDRWNGEKVHMMRMELEPQFKRGLQ